MKLCQKDRCVESFNTVSGSSQYIVRKNTVRTIFLGLGNTKQHDKKKKKNRPEISTNIGDTGQQLQLARMGKAETLARKFLSNHGRPMATPGGVLQSHRTNSSISIPSSIDITSWHNRPPNTQQNKKIYTSATSKAPIIYAQRTQEGNKNNRKRSGAGGPLRVARTAFPSPSVLTA